MVSPTIDDPLWWLVVSEPPLGEGASERSHVSPPSGWKVGTMESVLGASITGCGIPSCSHGWESIIPTENRSSIRHVDLGHHEGDTAIKLGVSYHPLEHLHPLQGPLRR